jgi:hypothetical protein
MTEEQWLGCTTNPTWMLNHLRGRVSDRKLRLFAVACCRSIFPHVPEARRGDIEPAIDAAERFADGLASVEELIIIHREMIPWDYDSHAAIEACNPDALHAARRTVRAAADFALTTWVIQNPRYRRRSPEAKSAKRAELVVQTGLARAIFANPFQPVTIAPSWLSWNNRTVPTLAQQIYEERAFEQLPILADALEEAGCQEPSVLDHCRGGGARARGCWVVDLVLGRQ